MNTLGIDALDTLINQLSKLPGIGHKTAQRLALFILKSEPAYSEALAGAIIKLKQETRLCTRCFNIAESELCSICRSPQRDNHTLCVVEDIVDVMAIESSNEYKGLYHVLGGVISPLAGIMQNDLHMKELFERVEKEPIKEILLALNPSTEGEATMLYISRQLKESPVRITRIASGVPIGSHLEYVDAATIGRAILSRQDL
ncbi:MAG TPA: recombination protein RecR [Caldithrix abyssi]|uniref:Recombination protein RecR n=1 Tax=Caldithrix abyssi TaxID=187145 RepID=A0A7V4WXB0_CALAY|nr:recombination protein RecR [Caldithrix abyssi]